MSGFNHILEFNDNFLNESDHWHHVHVKKNDVLVSDVSHLTLGIINLLMYPLIFRKR